MMSMQSIGLLLGAALVCTGFPRTASAMRTPPPEVAPTVRLSELARQVDGRVQRLPTRQVVLRAGRRTLNFTPDSRKLLADDVLIWLHAPAMPHGRTLLIAAADAEYTVLPLFKPATRRTAGPVPRIAIDPGHGGRDSGAIGAGGLKEKDIVLDIAQRIGARLEAAGIEVLLTRSNDADLSLTQRSALAGHWNADAFVSIHLNASANAASSGVETFVLTAGGHPSTSGSGPVGLSVSANAFDAGSILLAYAAHKQVVRTSGSEDRGIRRARFSVLREAPCPAALIECGFLSNPEEEARLATVSYRQRLAEAIAAGLAEYAASLVARDIAIRPSLTR